MTILHCAGLASLDKASRPRQLNRSTSPLEIMNITRIMNLFLILVILLSISCARSNSQSAVTDLLQNKALTEENVLAVLDKIAVTDLNSEDYKREEIASIISAINEPKLLFDLIPKLKERMAQIPCDGKCIQVDRYYLVIELSMKRLSNLGTAEAAKYLVKIIETNAVQGHAHWSEELLHNIAVIGQPALPYLYELKDKERLAQFAIECIENNDPCD